MASELKALRDIITSSIDQIIQVCESTGKDFPNLNEPLDPSEFTPEGIRNHPQVVDATSLAVSAALQLVQTIRAPATTFIQAMFGEALPAALGIAERANVAEVLRKAGPKGLHVKEIAAHTTIDPKKLSRVLRYLATNHWFIEVSPEVFANNRISSFLDTGKEPTPNLRETKYVGGTARSNFAAAAGWGADEISKGLAFWGDVLFDPKTAFSERVEDSGIQRALGTPLDIWNYYASPEGSFRASRFNAAMLSANLLITSQAIVSEFDWSSVPKNGLVVDVGGGRGQVSLEIAKAFPTLNFVIEDRPSVVGESEKYWNENYKSSVANTTVTFLPCDFFDSQPKLPAVPDVFLLRMIIHDWSDLYAQKLLSNLRAAAGPNTRLVLIDYIIKYACETPASHSDLGVVQTQVPAPLLPNLGGASLTAYASDLMLGSNFNALERTVDAYKTLIEASGWKLTAVRTNPTGKNWWSTLICTPA